jgi:succinoglycan biosynthesis protein ExoO
MLPIFSGTGMRIKAVEALGHGCPLIGTELGMRGVGSPEREAFVLAESADQFAEVAVALVKNPKRLSRMGVAAADHVRQRLSADRLVQNRERIWQDVISSVRSE